MDFSQEFLTLSNRLNQLCVYKDILQRNCSNVSRMECALLQYLLTTNKPVCMNEYSTVLNVSHSRITRIVDNLVKKGYVKRYPSQQDRRKWFTEITEVGLNMAKSSQQENLNIQQRIVDLIPEDRRIDVLDNLKIYLGALQTVVNEEEENE